MNSIDARGDVKVSKIGIGFIGCGGIHNNHAKALADNPDAYIACAMDVNEDAVKKHQGNYGTECGTTRLDELLANDAVQAVVVCTPTGLHPEHAIAAAQAGKHVLCEKPMALTVAEAERMAQACADAGVVLQIAFVRHFCNEWLKLREIIQSGAIGRPVVWRSVSASGGPASPWFFSKKLGGGPFIDGAVHNYDFARFTFGDATGVCANLRTMRDDSDAWDTGTAIVDFTAGDQLIMCWSWGLPKSETRISAGSAHDILGPGGAITFTGEALKVTTPAGEELVSFEPDGGLEWFKKQMAHFIGCVQTGSQPETGGREGIEATRIAEAILNIGDQPAVVKL